MTNELDFARELISKSRNIIILAGAGMSEELGVKTYWTGNQNIYCSEVSEYGYTAYEHGQGSMWDTHRAESIGFHHDNLLPLVSTPVNAPTSPYKLLLDYLTQHNKTYFVMTTNVDGAFERAGYGKDSLYETHGTRLLSQCLEEPQSHGVFPTVLTGDLTLCPTCQSDTRPNCLFFVDFEFNPKISHKQQDAFVSYHRNLKSHESVVIEIGAGSTIATIRNQSLKLNSKQHIPVIRINKHEIHEDGGLKNILKKSPHAPFLRFEMGAGEAITKLLS